LYDLDEDGRPVQFRLADLPKNIEAFTFILGVQKRTFRDQDPVNIEASERMGKLHDALKDSGYVGHDLERLLVRLLFCLFADDTGIFEPRDIGERRKALDIAHSVLVQAPAGYGKTTLLTERFLGLLSQVDDPRQIVAITFTTAAAAEMRHRILDLTARQTLSFTAGKDSATISRGMG
jgi:hypothetical protein